MRIFVILCFLIPITLSAELNIFGYFATKLEKTFNEPVLANDGTTDYESSLYEWDYGSFNLMMQEQLTDKIQVFINVNGAGANELILQNYWGEYSFNRYINVRVGKIYRKFGLYNEILDAVPTYYGIEPPELFDGDHQMISRFTTFMIHGSAGLGSNGLLNYAFSTGNGPGGPAEDKLPLSFDLNYNYSTWLKIGTSGYVSGENATPDAGLGQGASEEGVLPWMASDNFNVFGGYFEINKGNLMIQAAYWTSSHEATRDPASVVEVINNANINSAQRERFLVDPNGTVEEANVNTEANYDINTWYIRAGYSIETSIGEIAPYVQWDYFSNPETIQSKTWGGDAEAGAADDGAFHKPTIGVILRPTYQLAFKIDHSYHLYEFNGEAENYPEIRFNLSYTFGL